MGKRPRLLITAGLFVLVGLLVTYAGPSRTAPSMVSRLAGVVIVENEGTVCFEKADRRLQGHFQPKGCFSSSCTYAIEETLSVKLDNTRNRIRFRSRFVLIDRLPWDTCTADCGAVDIGFDIRYADLGNYSVWIGEKRLGALRIPSKLSLDQRICFSSDHPVTVSGPTPTPTGTPTWTPTAGFDYSPLSPLSVPNRHLPTRPFTLSPALAATASPTASTTPTPEPPALSVAPASTFSTSDTGSATVPIEGQGSTPTP